MATQHVESNNVKETTTTNNSNNDNNEKISHHQVINGEVDKHVKHRDRLPHPMIDRSKYSIWNILKQCVDKELYRFTIPVIWNEPLSLLQRMAENTKYANIILDKAASSKDPIERMKLVATFLVSSISMHSGRLSKPFNPLLGETYELIRNDYRICLEQVSHHPPISAYHAESLKQKWKYYGSVHPQMKLNFFNASIEAMPEGVQTIEFPELDETYTWNNVKVNAHNLLIGKLWFEYTGQAEIINHKLKIRCIIDFKPYSWLSRLINRVEGFILDADDNKVSYLSGQWDQFLYSCDDMNNSKFFTDTQKLLPQDSGSPGKKQQHQQHNNPIKLLWKTDLNEEDIYGEYYNFTQFTFLLNELTDNLKSYIAPTDSRLRPDIRYLENGDADNAAFEKNRLEEKQREVQRRVQNGQIESFKPLWFVQNKNHVTGDDTWVFTNDYWKRDYVKCADIY